MGFGFKRCTLWLFKNCWNEKLWGFVSAVPYQKHISAGRQWILPFCWAPRYPLLSVSLIIGFDVFLEIRPNEKKKNMMKTKLSGGDFWISEFPQERFSGRRGSGSGGGRPPGALRAPRPRCAPRHSGSQRVTGSGDRKAVKRCEESRDHYAKINTFGCQPYSIYNWSLVGESRNRKRERASRKGWMVGRLLAGLWESPRCSRMLEPQIV